MRSPNPDHICGLCDEFDLDQAGPSGPPRAWAALLKTIIRG